MKTKNELIKQIEDLEYKNKSLYNAKCLVESELRNLEENPFYKLEQKIEELENKLELLDETNRELEYKIEDKHYNLINPLQKLFKLIETNTTPYSQLDNDIWGIKQELEKIMEVDL